MRKNNDVELAEAARNVQRLSGLVDKAMRDGTPDTVLLLAGKIENEARHMGWRARHLLYRKESP